MPVHRDRWIAGLLLGAMATFALWIAFPLPVLAWLLTSAAIWLVLGDRPAWQRSGAIVLFWLPILGYAAASGWAVGIEAGRIAGGDPAPMGTLRDTLQWAGIFAVPVAASLVGWHLARDRWPTTANVVLGLWAAIVLVIPVEDGFRMGSLVVDGPGIVIPAWIASLATAGLLLALLIRGSPDPDGAPARSNAA